MDTGEGEKLLLKKYSAKLSSSSELSITSQQTANNKMSLLHEEECREQPPTHEMNKSFSERLLAGCCIELNNDLNPEELKCFYKLRELANEPYEKENHIHQDLLRRLYQLLFNERCESLLSKKWVEVGFQNKDVTKDIRGAGIMAIKNLVFFCENCKQDVQLMCLEESDFLFGITSINISFFIKKYFHLIRGLSMKSSKPQVCSRKTLKNFARILANERVTETEIYNRLYVFLMRRVFLIWKRMRKFNPDLLLIHFDAAILALKREVEVCFQRGEFNDLQTLFIAYKNITSKVV